MKKIFLAAILALFFSSVQAQSVDSRAVSYSVRYEKEHLFLQKDSGFNVVDYDIEWPEVLGYSYAPEMKRCISGNLTGMTVLTFDSLRTSILQEYGTPVTGMFKTIPDDRRFCYVTASARIVAYSPDHWIAYSISLSVNPGKLSKFKAVSGERVVVYDIPEGRLLNAQDLVNANVVERNEPQDFYDNLFAPLDDDFGDPDEDFSGSVKTKATSISSSRLQRPRAQGCLRLPCRSAPMPTRSHDKGGSSS